MAIKYILGVIVFCNLYLTKSEQNDLEKKYEICLSTYFSSENTVKILKNGKLDYEGRMLTDESISWAGSFYFELNDTIEINYRNKKVLVTFEEGYFYNEVRFSNDSLFLNNREVNNYGNN